MKFFGQVGIVQSEEDPVGSGIWIEKETEHDCYGDVNRVNRTWEHAAKLNDDFNVSNEISILCDPFINENLRWIRYVVWNGVKWKVSGIEVQYPRLTLSIGGVYNAEQA